GCGKPIGLVIEWNVVPTLSHSSRFSQRLSLLSDCGPTEVSSGSVGCLEMVSTRVEQRHARVLMPHGHGPSSLWWSREKQWHRGLQPHGATDFLGLDHPPGGGVSRPAAAGSSGPWSGFGGGVLPDPPAPRA